MSGCCGSSGDSNAKAKGGCCSEPSDVTGAKSNGACATAESEAAFIASDEQPVMFTPAAVEAVKQAIQADGEPGDGLRVAVVGGGCSGYQYSLDFDKAPRMGDLSLTFGGVSVFVDPVSAGYLKGTVVDFVTGLNGNGFKFNNPNAKRTCGCGSSFS